MQEPEASRAESESVALLLVVRLELAEERPARIAQVLLHVLK